MVLPNPLRQRRVPLPFRFMARRQQHERRVVSVSLDQSISLVVEHSLHRRTNTDLVPHARFDLQVETDLIGGFESGFGWSPRMKPHVVQTPRLARLEYLLPRRYVRWWIAGLGKVAGIHRAPKVDRPAVKLKFLADCFQLTQTDLQVVILFDAGAPQPQP